MFLNGNLVREVETGGITHTLLVGAEYVDANNANLRYDSYWSPRVTKKHSKLVKLH